MADNRNGQNRNNQGRKINPQNRANNCNPNMQNYQGNSSDKKESNGLSSTIKGIIAIMLTLLVVIVVIMIFAKTLFINNSSTPKKTGSITSTEYIAPVTTTTEEVVTSKETKKTTTKKDSDPYTGEDNGDGVEITCTSAVYLHPEASSSSETLLTIPSGATCTFYRNDNGWYYVEYNGTTGYAWQTYFTTPETTSAN